MHLHFFLIDGAGKASPGFLFEQLALFGFSEQEQGAAAQFLVGFVVKPPEEGILESVPGLVAGRQRIGHGMQGEHAQVFHGLDEVGKVADDGGVLQVAALGEVSHGEVMFDEEPQGMGGGAVQVQASGDFNGDLAANLGMGRFLLDLAGIVKEHGQVEDEGTLDFLKFLGVAGEGWILGGPDLVEFFQADQGVFVGGVLVVELVLNQAG